MANIPRAVEAFLAAGPIIVAGVSRSGKAPANAIYRRLRDGGHEPIPVNPNASEVEGAPCFPSVESVPGTFGALMVVTHPDVSADVVRAALARGVKHIWFHRSIGEGSVSAEAVALCRAAGVEPVVGGCPLMYCPPVDVGHRFFRWWLGRKGTIPR